MTKTKYLEMCVMMGDEPSWDKVPLDPSEMSFISRMALTLYNKMPNRYLSGMATQYIGKDYSILPMLYQLFGVLEQYHLGIYEVIHYLDYLDISAASKQATKKPSK